MNEQLTHALSTLPRFSAIDPTTIVAAIDDLLASNMRRLDELLATGGPYSWESLMTPLEEMADALHRRWSPISHLHGVADSEALRAAYGQCLPKIAEYKTRLAQDPRLFRAYRALREDDAFGAMTPAQRKVIDNGLRDFRLNGIDLDGPGKDRFRDIVQALSRLTTRFEENVLDATRAWTKHVTDRAQLQGLPETVLDLAAQYARDAGLEGWVLTLDVPSYMPVMLYAENRALREEMYAAYVTRASDQGPDAGRFDNSVIMEEILGLRAELARLAGFGNYAAYSLETKIAGGPDDVLAFLADLAEKALPAAREEYRAIESFAAKRFGIDHIQAWDIAFCGEKLRQERFAISQEELRPYFPMQHVIDGLFAVVKRLFAIDITPCAGVDVWHPDVSFYQIHDDRGSLRGMFYLDPYARAGKRPGAWMDECIVRKASDTSMQLPVAYLTCNFTPPVGNAPCLLTHTEVVTLFHEFGHGLHHMLTLVDHPAVSGINGVAWDAVELPSQFLENWCWQRDALDLISAHYETGEPLNDDLCERMIGSKNFQAGMQTVRQLEFAMFDFRLHLEYEPGMSVQFLLDEVRREVAVVSPPPFNRFQHSFSHIFAGDYAAGYYSYKWAEVLSADAFSRFEEDGIFNGDTGLDFLHDVLEQGGARDADELFVAFRGREPQVESLLRHCGLLR